MRLEQQVISLDLANGGRHVGFAGLLLQRDVRIFLITRLVGALANGQAGIAAENRPAVPPATTIFRFSGVRNFGMSMSFVCGFGKVARTSSGSPSPSSRP